MTQAALVWDEPGWLEQAQAWVRSALEARQMQLVSAIEQFHARP